VLIFKTGGGFLEDCSWEILYKSWKLLQFIILYSRFIQTCISQRNLLIQFRIWLSNSRPKKNQGFG